MELFKRLEYVNLEGDISKRNKKGTSNLYILLFVSVGIAILTIITVHLITLNPEKVVLKQSAENNSTGPIVKLNDGRISGKTLMSRGGREFFRFFNIPYAKPPVGSLRFEPPEKFTEGWTGIRDGNVASDRCIQMKIGSSEVRGSEDCLYLSVFTPTLPSNGLSTKPKMPVMVYILGGGFIGGHGSTYGADYLMDKEIVLVIPEYRVGVMGNLNTEDAVVPGNMGFKDQVKALEWVQANIKKFGGDPKKVTIFGNSSGAMSIHAHIFSLMSKGLFHAAISQSGVALCINAITRNPLERAQDIGTKIGCPVVNNTRELIQCLKTANVSDIVSAQSMELTGLTVEPIPEDGDLSQVFLPDTSLNLLEQGKIVSAVPWIIGINSGESAYEADLLFNSTMTEYLNKNWKDVGPSLLQLDVEPLEKAIEMAEEIKHFYFGDKDISAETKLEFVNMVSDRQWAYPSYVTATLYAKTSGAPVYLYWLTHEPVKSMGSNLEEFFDPPRPVLHVDEVQFLFPFTKYPYISLDSPDANFSIKMIDIWTTFGSGQSPLLDNEGKEIWTPVDISEDPIQWLQLDEEPQMVDVLAQRMTFWESFSLTDLFLSELKYS